MWVCRNYFLGANGHPYSWFYVKYFRRDIHTQSDPGAQPQAKF